MNKIEQINMAESIMTDEQKEMSIGREAEFVKDILDFIEEKHTLTNAEKEQAEGMMTHKQREMSKAKEGDSNRERFLKQLNELNLDDRVLAKFIIPVPDHIEKYDVTDIKLVADVNKVRDFISNYENLNREDVARQISLLFDMDLDYAFPFRDIINFLDNRISNDFTIGTRIKILGKIPETKEEIEECLKNVDLVDFYHYLSPDIRATSLEDKLFLENINNSSSICADQFKKLPNGKVILFDNDFWQRDNYCEVHHDEYGRFEVPHPTPVEAVIVSTDEIKDMIKKQNERAVAEIEQLQESIVNNNKMEKIWIQAIEGQSIEDKN